MKTAIKLYYYVKPWIPRGLQLALRRRMVLQKRANTSDVWPIDPESGRAPEGWTGWPEGKQFALVLTHDVDTETGRNRCRLLVEMEKRLGFVSSFNFVPRRYDDDPDLRRSLCQNGCEVAVHGLYHDGKYYTSRKVFKERAVQINRFLREWGAVGFRSPSMLHNLEWILDLDILYDASTFDTDPFEPQPDGVRTIFPFIVPPKKPAQKGYVELPYTLPQDFTLFVLMKEQTIETWKRKADWVAERGGMVLMNVHPDYMKFNSGKPGIEEYPAERYEEFLNYLREKYAGHYLHLLPREMASLWMAKHMTS